MKPSGDIADSLLQLYDVIDFEPERNALINKAVL